MANNKFSLKKIKAMFVLNEKLIPSCSSQQQQNNRIQKMSYSVNIFFKHVEQTCKYIRFSYICIAYFKKMIIHTTVALSVLERYYISISMSIFF